MTNTKQNQVKLTAEILSDKAIGKQAILDSWAGITGAAAYVWKLGSRVQRITSRIEAAELAERESRKARRVARVQAALELSVFEQFLAEAPIDSFETQLLLVEEGI